MHCIRHFQFLSCLAAVVKLSRQICSLQGSTSPRRRRVKMMTRSLIRPITPNRRPTKSSKRMLSNFTGMRVLVGMPLLASAFVSMARLVTTRSRSGDVSSPLVRARNRRKFGLACSDLGALFRWIVDVTECTNLASEFTQWSKID